MQFIHRLGISVALAAVIPLFIINYSLALAYETHLIFVFTISGLFMLPLSMYSSPVAPVKHDANGNPIPAYTKEAAFRLLVGRYFGILSATVYFAFLLFASYSFAEKYEDIVLFPAMASGFIGAYLYLVPMCPYCKKLNSPNLRQCENCGNDLLPNVLQQKSA